VWMAMTDTPFSQTLLTQRERYNAKFAEARHFRPTLDADTFSAVLREQCAPIANAVAQVHPNAVPAVTDALYEIALDLTAQGLLGHSARYTLINEAWATVLPHMAAPIANAPQQALSAITNGLYHLLQTPGAQAQRWLDGLTQIAASDISLDGLLQSGQVLAWRCGMAHYRAAALDLCRHLPDAVVRLALALPDGANVSATVAQLKTQPWHRPDQPNAAKALRVVARVGAFRGLGGLFMSPPSITCLDGQFIAHDGAQAWLICADAFGATLHAHQEPLSTTKQRNTSDFKLIKGVISKSGYANLNVPELETITSMATDGTTLAVTTPYSHAITLVAAT